MAEDEDRAAFVMRALGEAAEIFRLSERKGDQGGEFHCQYRGGGS